MKIGERLAAIAAMVPAGSRIADIGTDHALLPVFLVSRQLVSFVIAGETNLGPYKVAAETVSRLNMRQRISVRFGDGLTILAAGEVDTVVIAGMGGATIIDILTARPEITSSLQRLILQPMTATAAVRRWLVANGWIILQEDLVLEENKLYEIIAAEQGNSPHFDPVFFDIGPELWRTNHPLLKTHIQQLIRQLQRIIQEMKASSQAYNSPKYQEYVRKLKCLEDRYLCL